MRISDWSSDVCSSDLHDVLIRHHVRAHPAAQLHDQRVGARTAPVRGRQCRALDPAFDRAIEEALRLAEIRSEEHTSELQSLMRISYAVFCLKKKQTVTKTDNVKPNDIDKH